MTTSESRLLGLVADLAGAIRRQGSEQDGNWGHPSSSLEFARIETEAREAARSAGGGALDCKLWPICACTMECALLKGAPAADAGHWARPQTDTLPQATPTRPTRGEEAAAVEVQGVEVTRRTLRRIVDATWNVATESDTVPSTEWADRIIQSVLILPIPETAAGLTEPDEGRLYLCGVCRTQEECRRSDKCLRLSAPVPTLQDASHVPPTDKGEHKYEPCLHCGGTVYFASSHDNFYCTVCRKGQGFDYYGRNLGKTPNELQPSPSQEGRAGELRACPFCGGCRIEIFPQRDGLHVMCKDCHAKSGPEFHGPLDKPSSKDRAIAAWNRRAPLEKPSGLKLHFTNEWLRRKVAEEPDDASCEAGVLHPDAPIPDSDLRKIIDGQRAIIERLRQERDEAYTELARDTDAAILRRALLRIRSYNEDIHADKMNYRPLDHIQVIDEALAIAGRAGDWTASDTELAKKICIYLGQSTSVSLEPGDRIRDTIAGWIAIHLQSTGGTK